MGIKYDSKVEQEVRETNQVARDTGSSYKQAEQAREDQRRDERESRKEDFRDKRGKC